jgi:hypothetical protein
MIDIYLNLLQVLEDLYDILADHQRVVTVVGIKVIPRRSLWISLWLISVCLDFCSKSCGGLFLRVTKLCLIKRLWVCLRYVGRCTTLFEYTISLCIFSGILLSRWDGTHGCAVMNIRTTEYSSRILLGGKRPTNRDTWELLRWWWMVNDHSILVRHFDNLRLFFRFLDGRYCNRRGSPWLLPSSSDST